VLHPILKGCVFLLAAIGAAVCIALLLIVTTDPGLLATHFSALRPPPTMPWRLICVIFAAAIMLAFRWTRPFVRVLLPLAMVGGAYIGMSGDRHPDLPLAGVAPLAPPTADTWPAFREAATRLQKIVLPSIPQLFDK
jgi:hypothetical protein